jgi:hypothetical protein
MAVSLIYIFIALELKYIAWECMHIVCVCVYIYIYIYVLCTVHTYSTGPYVNGTLYRMRWSIS